MSADALGKAVLLLKFRAKFAWIWRLGIIKRTTAFRWEMDAALGSRK